MKKILLGSIILLALVMYQNCNKFTPGKFQLSNQLNGKLKLNWNAPVERQDDTPLAANEVSHYVIHYGLSSGTYDLGSVRVEANLNNFEVPSLEAGKTYYIVMTTVDTGGRESSYSNEIIKVAD